MSRQTSFEKFEKTKSLKGQELYLYSYVLLTEEKDGVIGFIKVVSAHESEDAIEERFTDQEVWSTNKGASMKIGDSGVWQTIRRPETDTGSTMKIVTVKGEEEEDFMGEKIVRRSEDHKIKNINEIKERAEIDMFKENVKRLKDQERKIELRQMAMQELEEELSDKTSLAYYAQLHFKRLTQKNAINEHVSKIEEAQKALKKTLQEIDKKDKTYPDYQTRWQDEIRRITKATMPSQAHNNLVDKPIANLEREDKIVEYKPEDIKDPYDQGVGVENKEEEKDEEKSIPFQKSISKNKSKPKKKNKKKKKKKKL